MSLLEALPAGAMPFLAAVVAGVIGFILWRLFQLALKVVAFIAFCIVMVGVFAWWQPELFGLGKQVVEQQVLPGVDQATRDIQQRAREAAKAAAKDAVNRAVNDAVGDAVAPAASHAPATTPTPAAAGSP